MDRQPPRRYTNDGKKTPKAPAIVLSLGFEWEDSFVDPIQKRMGLTEKEAKRISKRLRVQDGGLWHLKYKCPERPKDISSAATIAGKDHRVEWND